MKNKNRLRELDFLRGVAIVLVLFRHTHLHPLLKNVGWIGVDLFFVLSGYLVSNLLFKEYKKFGSIRPKRFLIRRGFKIYPIYYFTLLFYLAISWNDLDGLGLLGDLVFIQNYVNGWGYLYDASWSLAVEEHFYFGLAIIFWRLFKSPKCRFYLQSSFRFETVCFAIFSICLILRIISNVYFPELYSKNFTSTHLRIDSLVSGVLLSYWINYKYDYLSSFIRKYQGSILLLIPVLLGWTALVKPFHSIFAMTIGFSFIYIGFTLLLAIFLTNSKINNYLDRFFSRKLVDVIALVGISSYSIYVIHTFINMSIDFIAFQLNLHLNNIMYFLVTTCISVGLGILITKYLENYILNVRDKYFPSKY